MSTEFMLFPSIAKAVVADTVKEITGVVKMTPHYSVLVPNSSDDYFYLRTERKVQVEIFATMVVEVPPEEDDSDKKKKRTESTFETREVVIKRFPLDVPLAQSSLVDTQFYAELAPKAKRNMMKRIQTVIHHLKAVEQRRHYEESFEQSAPPPSNVAPGYGRSTISLPQPGEHQSPMRREIPMVETAEYDLAVSRIRTFINKVNDKAEATELTVREFFTMLREQNDEASAEKMIASFEDKIATEMRRAVIKM